MKVVETARLARITRCALVAVVCLPALTVSACWPKPTSLVAPTVTEIYRVHAPLAKGGTASEPIQVFVSTDMSSDDVVALLYLLKHPDVEVLGIGSSDGVAHVEAAAENVLRLLAVVGKSDIPVAVGKDGPIDGDHAFPSAWRSGADRLFDLDVAEAESELWSGDTAKLLTEVVDAHPGEVTVLLLGAHTDLALALLRAPSLAERISAVWMMGGAVHVPGNVHAEHSAVANEVAEWNLWLDPVATAEVFGAGIPLTVVPLDVTNQVKVTSEERERFSDAAQSSAAKAVAQLWRRQSSGGFYVWDVVAAVALTTPEAGLWETDALTIETQKPDHLGQTVLLEGEPPNADVCVGMDAERLHAALIEVLNR